MRGAFSNSDFKGIRPGKIEVRREARNAMAPIAASYERRPWMDGTSARKMETGIILEGYSHAISSSWAEMPNTKSSDDSLIDVWAYALK